jgi:glycerol-3-phosphate O-acyltransferase
MRPEDKERALGLVTGRVAAAHRGQEEELLADSLFHEQRRLRHSHDALAAADTRFWSEVQRELMRSSGVDHQALFARAVRRYAEEICGNFNDTVYKLSTKLLPGTLNALLNAVSPTQLVAARAPRTLEESVLIQGEVETFQRLAEQGTCILVPTHQSHLDSVIAGWMIHRVGLPPFLYGAGLNLFTNPLLSFFMHNLGAYTVDRRKRDTLYKEVLKEYATVTLELGYHNLFFPGGTRARGGNVETKLKLGLVGSGLQAYINNLRQDGHRARRIFIIPCTFSYQLVLEAETLIDDFLKEEGKSRYIITDDEFSRPRRILEFITHLFSLESRIYCTVGQAIDPFGNRVDAQGVSLDPHGRPIDLPRYVGGVNNPHADAQRDAEYTKEVGDAILRAYRRDNVIQNTHLVARAQLELLRKKKPDADLFRLLRDAPREPFPAADLLEEVDRLVADLRDREARGQLRLDPQVRSARGEVLVRDALRAFSSYHSRPALERRGTEIYTGQPNLLLYYANRLEGYGPLGGARPERGERAERPAPAHTHASA